MEIIRDEYKKNLLIIENVIIEKRIEGCLQKLQNLFSL